jgi:putative transcriptional regulator
MKDPESKSSSILNAVHETAQNLQSLGFIDKRAMRRYDALCLDPIPNYTAEDICSLRGRYRISQAVLATVLNISLSTVQKWEIGEKHPGGPSLKLLNILDRKGLDNLI